MQKDSSAYTILIVDGQGGGIGKSLIEKIRARFPELTILACGTNAVASNTMLKAGADAAATGENAICFNAARADIILGVMGIVIPNSMMGELTLKMAEAITSSRAPKILVPLQRCGYILAIKDDCNIMQALDIAVEKLEHLLVKKECKLA